MVSVKLYSIVSYMLFDLLEMNFQCLFDVLQVGCMGFCMGGALTFLAGQEAQVDAIAPFYGTPDPKLAKVWL